MTWFLDSLRRKGKKDAGFVLVSTMLLFIMVGGTAYAMWANAGRTVQTSVLSRDFNQAGQQADFAVQDAVYYLNENPGAALPTASTPRKCGTCLTGEPTWEWYADPVVAGAGGKKTTIHAQGSFRGATRKADAVAQAPRIGAFKIAADNSVSYEVAPSTAFGYTVMGRDITVTNGIGLGAGSKFLTGPVGLIGAGLNLDPSAGISSSADSDITLFGAEASKKRLDRSARVPAALHLDPSFITEITNQCGSTPPAWKASARGALLTASDAQSCWSSMDFDVPTLVQGNGAHNVFVSGPVTFRNNVTVSSTASLNIYANGSVEFRTEEASSSSLNINRTFIYAPTGACRTQPVRSTIKKLDYNGSLACDTVNVAGQITGSSAVKPLGDSVYDGYVWYLRDYVQPSGSRG